MLILLNGRSCPLLAGLLAFALTAPSPLIAGDNPLKWDEVVGLEVLVEDSHNCVPGSNQFAQTVTASAPLTGGVEGCPYKLAITVTGIVEAQNAAFDYVYVNGVLFFSGDEELAGCQMNAKTVTKEVMVYKGDSITLTYDTSDGLYHQGAKATIENIELVEENCSSGCEPGAGVASNGSLHMSFNLGSVEYGRSAGALRIAEATPSAVLGTSASLRYASAWPGINVIQDSNEHIRQVKAPQVLADVVTETAQKFRVDFYSPDAIGPLSGGLYNQTGKTPFVTWISENLDPVDHGHLRITEARGASSKVTEFVWDEVGQGWELVTGNGQRKDKKTSVADPLNNTVTVTQVVRNALNQVVSKTVNVYKDFPWGRELIESTVDPDGEALVTTYSFYDNQTVDGGAYSKLKSFNAPYGRWARYEYHADGRPSKTVEPFLDALPSAPENQCKVTSVTYNGLIDAREMVVVTILGQEVERRYKDASHTSTHETRSIVCTQPGAIPTANTNLVTVQRLVNMGPFTGELKYVQYPDNTGESYEYSTTSTTKTTIVSHGKINSGVVSSGTRTSSTTDFAGNLVQETVHDIESNLLLSQKTVVDQDDFGRPKLIAYDDATTESFIYGCCGVESHTDREEIVTEYTYDTFKRLWTEKRDGITTVYTYDVEGRLLSRSRIGSDNSVIVQETNEYNVAGRLTSTTDSLNHLTSFAETADGNGRLVRTTTYPNTGTRVETYHFDGRLFSTGGTAARPVKRLYGVDLNGYFEQEILIGEGGSETEWSRDYHNLAGRTVKTQRADGALETYLYSNKGQLEQQGDADLVRALYSYDGQGRQLSVRLDLRDGGIGQKTTTSYSVLTAHGSVVQRRETHVSIDSHTQVLAAREDRTLNGRNVWAEQWGLPITQTISLGGNGLKTQTRVNPDSSVNVLSYDHGRLVSSTTTGPGGTPVISSQTFGYDPHGRQTSVTDARNGTTAYTYDDRDRIHTVTAPVPGPGQPAQTTTYQYNSMDLRVKTILPDSSETNYQYTLKGEMEQQSGSQTPTLQYTYDPQGRIKTLTTSGQAGPAVTTWNYHPQNGRMISKVDDDDEAVAYTYTPAGRLHTRTWARGVVTTYSYDGGGRLTGIDYSDDTPDVTFTPNQFGHITSITDGSGTRVQTHATDGRLLTEEYTAGMLTGVNTMHGYDLLLRRSTHTVTAGPATHAVSFHYGAASRLESVESGGDSTTYGYLPNSSLIGTIVQQHDSSTVLTTTKTHDFLNRLKAISTANTSGVVSSHTYTYNLLNQRQEAVIQDGSRWQYQYDAKGQVIGGQRSWSDSTPVTGQQFGYSFDDIGNRTATEVNGRQSLYTPTRLNQYAQRSVPGAVDVQGSANPAAAVAVNDQPAQRKGGYFYRELPVDNQSAPQYPEIKVQAMQPGAGPGGADLVDQQTGHLHVAKTPEEYTHDPDGNLLSDGRWQYTWDAENRLKAMESIATLPAEARKKLVYGYDAQGRRVSKQTSTWNGSVYVLETVTRFIYDGWNLVAELNGANVMQQTYVWGLDQSGSLQGAGGVGGLLAILRSGERYYPAYDGNGNVMSLVRGSNQAIVARYGYGPFGELVEAQEEGVSNPFRFSTKYQDLETGLLYYGYRYYAPEMGRWISRDPIEERGGINLYGMGGNDPINQVDILGLYTKTIAENGIVTIKVDQCEIIILDGHGHAITPHNFEFPDPLNGCSARGGFIGCDPGTTNRSITNENRIPGLSYDNDSRLDTSGLMLEERRRVLEGALSEAKKLCECCKASGVTITVTDTKPVPKWYQMLDTQPNEDVVFSFDCATMKTTRTKGGRKNYYGYYPTIN